MRKKLSRLLTPALCLLLCAVILTGCGCKHEWKDATCTEPKLCALCGETEGEPMGHSWVEATCEAPKTCTACGLTEGEALGHSWTEATCENAKTCTVCGYAEQQAIDRMAKLMAYLEGDWYVSGAYYYGQYSDLSGKTEEEKEGLAYSLHVSSDGSIKFFDTDRSEISLFMDDPELEYGVEEEYEYYIFYMNTDDGGWMSSGLYVYTDGTIEFTWFWEDDVYLDFVQK